MKIKSFLLYFLFLSVFNGFVFSQDTLRNLSSVATRTINKYSSGWGYYTGSNNLYREEFAEKYYINGSRVLIGVISEHTGIVSNPNNTSQFRAYTVGSNGLPAALKASKNVPYGQINLTGNPMVTIFTNTAQVTDSFYVSFNLTDYAHGGFEGDTVGLMYGVHGSRPSGDLSKFGRNAIRRHSHAGPDWKDFYSQNFTPVATHFALFPILESSSVGINEIKTDEFTISKVYPNPFKDAFTLKLNHTEIENITVSIFNSLGQLVSKKNYSKLDFDMNNAVIINCSEINAGNYILFVKGLYSGIATQIIKE
jgi:hypothetical protein